MAARKTTNGRRRIAGERSTRRTATASTRPDPAAPPSATSVDQTSDRDAAASVAAQPAREAVRRSVPGWLLVGLTLLLVAAVAVDLVLLQRGHQQAEQSSARSARVAAAINGAPIQAEKAATEILGYDYRTLRADADRASTLMTDDFAASFDSTVRDLVAAPAKQVKAHVEAKVMASGVSEASPDKVEVLLFVDQTSRTSTDAQEDTALNRVVFTMVPDGSAWLVDDITAL
jgi:Mce-associated membrane protein